MKTEKLGALFVFLVGVSVNAAGQKDRWAMEVDVGGVAALSDPVVKKDGQSGSSGGFSVRVSQNKKWDTGVGYNLLSMEKGVRLRPATLFGDRFFLPSGQWTPYLRLGGGLSTDNAGGSFNRFAMRVGGGVKRSIPSCWEIGFKTELWYSPTSSTVGNDMLLLTAGLTLARTAPLLRTSQSVVLSLKEKKPLVPPPIQIRFRKEKWELSKSNFQAKVKPLGEIAEFLSAHPADHVELHGYADSRRPMGYDIVLSRKRAEALRDRLVTRWNMKRSRITVFAHGSDQRNLPKKCVVVRVIQNRDSPVNGGRVYNSD